MSDEEVVSENENPSEEVTWKDLVKIIIFQNIYLFY